MAKLGMLEGVRHSTLQLLYSFGTDFERVNSGVEGVDDVFI